MSALIAAAALASGIVPVVDLPPSDGDPCAAASDGSHGSESARSARFTLDDQVRLVDIGRRDPRGASAEFAVSPDGSRVAVNLS